MTCNGLCIDSGDVGVPGYGIAYAHPACPEHGGPHAFDPVDMHHSGAARCRCGAYEDEHHD